MARSRRSKKTEFTRDETMDELGAPTVFVEEVEEEPQVTNYCKQCEAVETLKSLEGDSSLEALEKRKACRQLLNEAHTCGK